jgi:hypothetical protein
LEKGLAIDYSCGMGVFKGVLGWILGDDPGQVEMEALPDEPASMPAEAPIFLSPSDLRLAVPAEYLRADAPFSAEDVKIKSSEFLDFHPHGPLRIPAFKLALWCPAFVSIPGGMKGDEIVEFPESVFLRSVTLKDPAGGEVDIGVVDSQLLRTTSFTPLRKGIPGSGDALSDEHGDPFADADADGEQVVLTDEEIEETRRALRETVLDTQSEGGGVAFGEVLSRESDADSKKDSPDHPSPTETSAQEKVMEQGLIRKNTDFEAARPRPQMSNVHRIMRAYLQGVSATVSQEAQGGPETKALASTEQMSALAPSGVPETSVEQLVQAERDIREKSADLLRPRSENSSQTFKRLERALSGYPTVTGVSARIPEGDFFSGDTSGYVSAGEASEEIRRAFSLTGSMSIRGEAVTCLTVFNETDAVTVLCSRNAQISIIHGTEGLPLSARRAASRWLGDLSA